MADPVELSPPVLSGRTLPVEVPPARPAVTNDSLRAPATEDRLQFTRQTRAPFLERYMQENASDAPLDMTTGLSSYDRFQLGLHRTEEDQRRYLEGREYTNIRKSTDGQWIVRASGADGTPVDLMSDPIGVEAGDWSELAASSPQMAFAAGGFLLGRYMPAALAKTGFKALSKSKLIAGVSKAEGLAGGARDVVASAAGAQAAGAIQDIATRVIEGAPVDIPEIARSRAVLGAMDTLISGTIGTGLGIARFLKNPWIRSRTDIQIDAIRAQREIADKYGIHIALTPAELTGSRIMTIEQARLAKVPGGTEALKKFTESQQAGPMRLFQEIMLGGRVPDSDVVGRQAIAALQMTTGATDATVDAARINLSKAALHELEETAATHSLAERGIEQGFVGDAIRNRMSALNDQAHAVSRSLFNKVRDLGGDNPIFEGSGLAKSAADLRKTLPPSFAGIPATLPPRAVTGAPTSVEFVPASIRGMLDELEAGKGHLWKLTDLQQMRRTVYDDIGKGNALPGYNTHYLSKIGSAITEAIEKGVEALPTSDLKLALQTANKDYIDNVLPFGKRGLAEMFVKDNEQGWVGSAMLASHYTSGAAAADRWRVLKEFVGGDSLEGRAVKRMAFDHVIGGSMEPGGQLLNAQSVLRRLAAFKESSPDLYKEMFGKAADDLQRVAKFAIAGEKDMLPAHEIADILRSGKGPTVTALRALKEAEQKQSTLYANNIMDGVRETGKWDISKIKPHEFVNRFIANEKIGPDEIKQVMSRIEASPGGLDLAGDIRASALEKFLNRHDTVTDIGLAMKKAETDKTMRAILGEDIFEDLHRYGALQKAILTTREKSIAGAFEGTTVVNMLLRLPIRFGQKVVGNSISSRVLTSSWLRNWALHQPESSEAVTMLMLSSPEFLNGVRRSFGDDSEGFRQAEAFLGATRRSLSESWAQRQAREAGQPISTNAPTRLSPPTLMLR